MGVILKAVASIVLLLVAIVSAVFAWGAARRFGESWLVFVVSTVIMVSCLWAVVRLWRSGKAADQQMSQQATFELWLAKKIVDSTELTDEQVAALRAEYEREFGDR